MLKRRLPEAEIEVRYADDGIIIYKGPIVTYFRFHGLMPSYLNDRFMLNWFGQAGIQLGLSGMAVGGKCRIEVDRTWFAMAPAVESNLSPKMVEPTGIFTRPVHYICANGIAPHPLPFTHHPSPLASRLGASLYSVA
jgi:hypothetical protein